MIWLAKFNGRNNGAIGITYPITTYAYGDDEDAARLDLCERYEHVMFLKLEPRPIVIVKECKIGDYIYVVENGKLRGVTDPQNSSWKITAGPSFPGFVNCQNQATGCDVQLNDGMRCIVRIGE